jgi:hypothetical protein
MSTSISDVRGIYAQDIHTWFGLSYANYLVLPRTLLQSMPAEWQHRFVGCLKEFDAAFAGVAQAHAYTVTPGNERELGGLRDDQLADLGFERKRTPCRCDDRECECPWTLYFDANGDAHEAWERVVVPAYDPVSHYNRGRTKVEPDLDAIEAVRQRD